MKTLALRFSKDEMRSAMRALTASMRVWQAAQSQADFHADPWLYRIAAAQAAAVSLRMARALCEEQEQYRLTVTFTDALIIERAALLVVEHQLTDTYDQSVLRSIVFRLNEVTT